MTNKIRDNIINILKNLSNKNITIKINGFILAKFYIDGLNYKIENDNLSIINKEENIYLSINLNQVYKYEYVTHGIEIFLDNDMILKILDEK